MSISTVSGTLVMELYELCDGGFGPEPDDIIDDKYFRSIRLELLPFEFRLEVLLELLLAGLLELLLLVGLPELLLPKPLLPELLLLVGLRDILESILLIDQIDVQNIGCLWDKLAPRRFDFPIAPAS